MMFFDDSRAPAVFKPAFCHTNARHRPLSCMVHRACWSMWGWSWTYYRPRDHVFNHARARGNASEWALPRFFYGCFYALGGGFSKLHYRFLAEGFMRFSPLCSLVPGFTWQLSLGWKL